MKKFFFLLGFILLFYARPTFAGGLKGFEIPPMPPKIMSSGGGDPTFLIMNCNGDITLPDDNGNTWYYQPCSDYLVFDNATPDRIFNYSIKWLDSSSTEQGQTGIMAPGDSYTINGPMILIYSGFSDILEQINRKAFWTASGGGLSTDTIRTIPFNSFYATSETSSVLIDQSWTYGDLFISFLLSIFLIWNIFSKVFHLFFPARVEIRRDTDL